MWGGDNDYFTCRIEYMKIIIVLLPYRLKLYTEFNLATWPRMVKFTELSIREFRFLDVKYICFIIERFSKI